MFKQLTKSVSLLPVLKKIFSKKNLTRVSDRRRSLSQTAEPLRFGEISVSRKFCRFTIAVLLTNVIAFSYSTAQNVTVSGAITGNGTYLTLASAFSAINGASQSGANINISITGNTSEPNTGATLNTGSWTSVTIQPSGGFQRTISAAVDPGFALINFNGADNVTIDGINSGGNSLVLSNTTVSSVQGTSTVRFENKTNNNIITRCSVLGSSTSKSSGANIYFGTSPTPGPGNNFNLISFCDIGPAGSNLPACGVASIGSIGWFNTGDTIRNCNIYDYFSAADSSSGISLPYYNNGFVIKDNKFYQTSPRTQTTGNPHSAISMLFSYGTNFTVTGNKIGYSSSSGTGTYSFTGTSNSIFYGITFEQPFFAALDVQNNTIAGILISGTMSGESVRFINVDNSVSANVSGNTVGSVTAAGSITYNTNTFFGRLYAIFCQTQNSAIVNNNTVGSITAANSDPFGGCAIGCISVTADNITCNYNNIGGNVPNSIHSANTTSGTNTYVYGVHCNGSNVMVTGNTITNLTESGGVSGGVLSQVTGITSEGGGATISQNFIYGLSYINNTLDGRVEGIRTDGNGPNLISKNLIHSFYSQSTAATLIGINCLKTNSTVQNNMIRLGLGTDGNSMNIGCTIIGMFEEVNVNNNNFYFNSIYVGGTATSGNSNTFGFRSRANNKTRNYLNNIFCNVRNGFGTAKNYAIGLDGGGAGLNCNHNILFAPNTGGRTGLYVGNDQVNLAAWRSVTNQDNNSLAKDPQFLNPASSFFFGLMISGAATPVEQKGIFISGIADDFYGAPRSALTPTDIGANAGNFIQSPQLSGNYTVGLGLFNRISGKNIYFEKIVRTVLKEVEETDQNDNSIKIVMKEVEEETFVPMENGEIYTGHLFVKRSDNPELPTDAMSGVFATINTALNELYSSGAGGPVKFLLLDEDITYEALPIYIGNWPNASITNTLTIKPQGGFTPTISGNSATIFDINTADYFILDGSNTMNGTTKDLTIANSSVSGSAIRFINDARRNTVMNCILKGNSNSNSNGVLTLLTTTGAYGNDSNLIQNNDITGYSAFPNVCVYSNGSGATPDQKNSDNKITGNKIYDFSSRGILDTGNSAATLYEENEIYSVTPMPGPVVGFRAAASSIEGFTFRNNFIRDLKTSGISGNNYLYGIDLARIQTSYIAEIYNNFISLSDLTSHDVRGINDNFSSALSSNICFNSINLTGIVSSGHNSEAYLRVNGSNTNFKNNILVNSRNGGGSNYAIRTSDTLNNFNSNHNDVYNAGGFRNIFGRIANTDIVNITDWRNTTGKDSVSISGDPKFISNTDLHIDSTQATPVSNKAIPVAGITTDIDGKTRSLTTPDIGADEFNGAVFPLSLDLTMYIEGFYDASSDSQISDTVKVYLRNPVSPYSIVDSARSVVAANGTCSMIFLNAANGSYYIMLTHRNSIQTWSSVAAAFTQGITTAYNFSNTSSQAYGNNLIQIDSSPLKFGIYSADVNQDDVVTLADIINVYNDAGSFETGYVVSDVNGDGIVNLADITIAFNNSAAFVSVKKP